MKRLLVLALTLSVAVLLAASINLADEAKEFKATCPVSGKAAKEASAVDYKGGKVYFCCDNCPEAFKKDTAKFATKANHQLVTTGQAEQKKCPISGRALNKEQTLKVADVEVTFCCPNCKGKVAKAEGKEQLELVFSDKAFEKAYEVKKEDKK